RGLEDAGGRRIERRRGAQRRIAIDEVVVRPLLPLQFLRGRRGGEREGLVVQGRLLVRVLPVAKVRDLVVREAQRGGEHGPLAFREIVVDRRIVTGGVLERFHRQLISEFLRDRPVLLQRPEDVWVPR